MEAVRFAAARPMMSAVRGGGVRAHAGAPSGLQPTPSSGEPPPVTFRQRPPRPKPVDALRGKAPTQEYNFHPTDRFVVEGAVILNDRNRPIETVATGHFEPTLSRDVDLMVHVDEKGPAELFAALDVHHERQSGVNHSLHIDRKGFTAAVEAQRVGRNSDVGLRLRLSTHEKNEAHVYFNSRHDNDFFRLHGDLAFEKGKLWAEGDWRIGPAATTNWKGRFCIGERPADLVTPSTTTPSASPPPASPQKP